VSRPREDWITIAVPALIDEPTFEAAHRAGRDNSQWSPRRAEPGQWLLRGLVKCGAWQVGTNCHNRRGRNGTWNRYYHCRNHDPIKAGGDDRRCTERNIRSDALDEFVFDQVRAALLRPDVLTAGEQALAVRTPAPDDELLAAELARLDRKLAATDAERRRLVDLYQAGLLELPELQRRDADVEHRRHDLEQRRDALTAQRHQLTRDNQLRHRVRDFASRVLDVIDILDFTQRQALLRLVVDDVHVTGWHVQIRLRIPLDDNPDNRPDHRTPRLLPISTTPCQPKTVCVHFVVTSRRCHRNTVAGVIRRWPRSAAGRRRISAANTARSAQSRRGFGLVLRSTATSWRRTRSSTSLDDDARGSSVSQLNSWLKIR
jgi:site-specific DNA recombinase